MTPLFGPGWGNYAIRGIVETTLPAPVSLYPVTPGWWLLLAAIIAAIAWRLHLRRKRWRANAYRRSALSTLESLRDRIAGDDREALRDLAPLLRATALAAGDRQSLAPLRGDAWRDALHALAPDLPPLPVQELERLAYAPLEELHCQGANRLVDDLARWIARHGGQHA